MPRQKPSRVKRARVRELPPPPTHLPAAILATVMFLPLGVIALVQALKTRRLLNAGQVDDARPHAASAWRWASTGLVAGTVVWVVALIAVPVAITMGGADPTPAPATSQEIPVTTVTTPASPAADPNVSSEPNLDSAQTVTVSIPPDAKEGDAIPVTTGSAPASAPAPAVTAQADPDVPTDSGPSSR